MSILRILVTHLCQAFVCIDIRLFSGKTKVIFINSLIADQVSHENTSDYLANVSNVYSFLADRLILKILALRAIPQMRVTGFAC